MKQEIGIKSFECLQESMHQDHLYKTKTRCLARNVHCTMSERFCLYVRMNAFDIGCRIVFGFFFASGFGFLFWLSFPVPFALYLQQFGTRTCDFAWYLLHFGMVTLHFAWYLLHLAMSPFHFAWYLSHFGISTSHLHGICYVLVLQTFMWVS